MLSIKLRYISRRSSSSEHLKKIKRSLSVLFVINLIFVNFLMVNAQADRPFSVGWYAEVSEPEKLKGFANDGCTLILANGGGWYGDFGTYKFYVQRYLDEAQKRGIKVIISLTRSNSCPYPISPEQFVQRIRAFKNHAALFGWYIADEPELFKGSLNMLANNPGYYRLCKLEDPNHPVLIVHSGSAMSEFANVTDLVGVDFYPGHGPEFSFLPNSYDIWRKGLAFAKTYNKKGFVAICQGIGINKHVSIRALSYSEYRFHLFTAVAQGVDKILFWADFSGWTNADVQDLVRQMIGQLQSIGEEMNNGVTNTPIIAVSESQDKMVYRYGVKGNSHVILAINIANRSSSYGATLSNVRFTLPKGSHASEVQVLNENRVIPVINGGFTDNFKKFEVHAYRFVTGSTLFGPPTGLRVVRYMP